MTHLDKNGKSKKSLGQDPFADLDDFEFEAIKIETFISSEPTVEEESHIEPRVENKATIETDPLVEESAVAGQEDLLGDEPQRLAEREPSEETAFMKIAESTPEIVVEPQEETDHLLDDLIARIDDEIERTLKGDLNAAFVEQRQMQEAKHQAQYVIFRLAGTEYAAPALNVKEVGELTNLTPVPNVPHWLQGVTNLRGDILSIVDLRIFLDLKTLSYEEILEQDNALLGSEQEILIAHPQIDPSLLTLGFIVDGVSDIDYLPLAKIVAPTSIMDDQLGPYIKGVYDEAQRMIIILDLDKLLLSPEMRQFEAI